MKKPTEPLGPTPPSEPLASQQPVALDPSQKNFYEAMVEKMKTLESYHKSIENQNRDLVDQMAETNRDMMKLEFRVDTHSESFRPMPVSEDPADLSLGDDTGVLPPRAELILPELDQSPVP